MIAAQVGKRILGVGAVCLLLAVTACVSAPRAAVVTAAERGDVAGSLAAYEAYRELDGPDGEVLAHVATEVLLEAAQGDDEVARNAAISQLQLAGTAGEPALERLGAAAGVPVARAKALEVLARRGHGSARAALYALTDSDEPIILGAAITAVDAKDEPQRLLEWLGHVGAEVRRAAALKLSELEGTEPRLALENVARVDPVPSVRSAAVAALGSYGPRAFAALRERLSDPESSVRLAAVRAIVRVDRQQGVRLLASLFATQASPAGIEAARVIILTGASGDDDPADDGADESDRASRDARTYLKNALLTAVPRLRSQAGIALVSLPSDAELADAVGSALEREEERSVRLQLARALHKGPKAHRARATVALEALLDGTDMHAVQAALILARDDHDGARARLRGAIAEGEPAIRRVAARGLARDAHRPDEVRGLLLHEDVLTRVAAAGGILAFAAAD